LGAQFAANASRAADSAAGSPTVPTLGNDGGLKNHREIKYKELRYF
jgi:hypothetical protein